MLELWGMWNFHSLTLFPGSLWSGVVAPDCVIFLYTHKDINNNSNTNTYTGGLSRFRYERVYWFMASVMRRETQFLKVYVNHMMLTPAPFATHLVVFKISTGKDKKNSIACLKDWKPNYSFKILIFYGPSLLEMTSSTLKLNFLSWGL